MMNKFQVVTIFLVVPMLVASSLTTRKKQDSSFIARRMKPIYPRTGRQESGLDQKVGSKLYEDEGVSTKLGAAQSVALQPHPLPEPGLSEKELLPQTQEKNWTKPIKLYGPTPSNTTTSRTRAIPTDFRTTVYTSVAPHPFYSNHKSPPVNEPTESAAPLSLELPLPSLLPLTSASPAVEKDLESIPPKKSYNTLATSPVPSMSQDAHMETGNGGRLSTSRRDGKTSVRLCSRCESRSDCQGQYACRKRFCVGNQRQLDQCERRVRCTPCGKGLPHCGRFARCVRGICVRKGQSPDECRRARRRAIQKIHKKMDGKSHKNRVPGPAPNLCDPCLHPVHCQGGRICSAGKPCRPLKCRAGFCSFSVRMSVRLCAKIDEFWVFTHEYVCRRFGCSKNV